MRGKIKEGCSGAWVSTRASLARTTAGFGTGTCEVSISMKRFSAQTHLLKHVSPKSCSRPSLNSFSTLTTPTAGRCQLLLVVTFIQTVGLFEIIKTPFSRYFRRRLVVVSGRPPKERFYEPRARPQSAAPVEIAWPA